MLGTSLMSSKLTGGAIQLAAHEAAAALGWDEASQEEYGAFLAGWWAHWRWEGLQARNKEKA